MVRQGAEEELCVGGCVSPTEGIDAVVGLTRKGGDWERCLGPSLWQVVIAVLMFGSRQGSEKEKQCLDQKDGARMGAFPQRAEAVYFSLGRLGPVSGVPIVHLFTWLPGPWEFVKVGDPRALLAIIGVVWPVWEWVRFPLTQQ